MKIIVCVKAVPASVVKLRIAETQDRVEADASSIVVNEADEYAMEQALLLKSSLGAEISAISAGPLNVLPALHIAMAKGADKAVRVDVDGMDREAIAAALAESIKKIDYDLILTGMESSDDMAAYVAISVATRLGLPFASGVTHLEQGTDSTQVRVHKELGGGVKEVLEISLPALLCIQPGIFELPYVPVRKLFMARSQPITTFTLSDLDIGKNAKTQGASQRIVNLSRPAGRAGEMIEGSPSEIAQALMRKIKEAS